MSICTPICPICYKSYNKGCEPRVYHPCGHGACGQCTTRIYIDNDNPQCPLCRVEIEHNTPNYDLIQITERVEYEDDYWGRRLLELIDIPGEEIQLSEKILPFSKLLCTRLVYAETLKYVTEIWSDRETEDIENLKKVMCKTFRNNDVILSEAYMWVEIMKLPTSVEAHFKVFLLEWFKIKNFLKEREAMWVMDVFSL